MKKAIWCIFIPSLLILISALSSCSLGYPSIGNWETLPNIPHAAADEAAALVENEIYLFGGYEGNEGGTNYTQIYSILNNTWYQGPTMPQPQWGGIASHYNDGTDDYIYVWGGKNPSGYLKLTQIFNVGNKSWTTKSVPYYFYGSCAIDYNGCVYLLGGYDGSTTYDTTIRYNYSSGVFTSLAHMPSPRKWSSAGLIGNKIYLVAGSNGGTKTNTTWVYNIDTDTWDTSPKDFPDSIHHGAIREDPVVDGKMYVINGFDGSGTFFKWVYQYNPANDTWTRKNDNLYIADGVAGAVRNGYIYCIGGRNTYPATGGVTNFTVYNTGVSNTPVNDTESFGYFYGILYSNATNNGSGFIISHSYNYFYIAASLAVFFPIFGFVMYKWRAK